MEKELLLVLSGSLLFLSPCSVYAQSNHNQSTKKSTVVKTAIVKNHQDNTQIINQEYKWLEKNTLLNKKAIVGVIASFLYESNDNPAYSQNGQGILAWNGPASIVVSNTSCALHSQLNYLNATMKLRGHHFIKQINKQKSSMDAALFFEMHYVNNGDFYSCNKKVYKHSKGVLKQKVLTVQKITQYQ